MLPSGTNTVLTLSSSSQPPDPGSICRGSSWVTHGLFMVDGPDPRAVQRHCQVHLSSEWVTLKPPHIVTGSPPSPRLSTIQTQLKKDTYRSNSPEMSRARCQFERSATKICLPLCSANTFQLQYIGLDILICLLFKSFLQAFTKFILIIELFKVEWFITGVCLIGQVWVHLSNRSETE